MTFHVMRGRGSRSVRYLTNRVVLAVKLNILDDLTLASDPGRTEGYDYAL